MLDALGSEVPQRVINRRLLSLIMDGGGATRGQPNLAIDPSQQEGAKVRGQSSPRTIGSEGLARDGRKTQLVWGRMLHKQTSGDFYGMDASHILFYQRRARGLYVFMKNSG